VISIRLEGFSTLQHMLGLMQRNVEISAQRALIKTANSVKKAEVAEMERVFDKPTRWTMGAMKVRTTRKFEVQVGILDPNGYYKRAANYLGTQIEGGQRRAKAMEVALQQYGLMPRGWFVVPGAGAQLDAYGNMSVGQIRQILSWFDTASRTSGPDQNMYFSGREKRRKGTKKTAGFEYIVIQPGGVNSFSGKRDTRALKQPGIYKRIFLGHGTAIKPILIFVKGARYAARFNFEKVARDTAAAMLESEFQRFMRDPEAR